MCRKKTFYHSMLTMRVVCINVRIHWASLSFSFIIWPSRPLLHSTAHHNTVNMFHHQLFHQARDVEHASFRPCSESPSSTGCYVNQTSSPVTCSAHLYDNSTAIQSSRECDLPAMNDSVNSCSNNLINYSPSHISDCCRELSNRCLVDYDRNTLQESQRQSSFSHDKSSDIEMSARAGESAPNSTGQLLTIGQKLYMSAFELKIQETDSDEMRKMKRRERNRIAALKCRDKKREYHRRLQKEVEKEQSDNFTLRQLLDQLKSRLDQLSDLKNSHQCFWKGMNDFIGWHSLDCSDQGSGSTHPRFVPVNFFTELSLAYR